LDACTRFFEKQVSAEIERTSVKNLSQEAFRDASSTLKEVVMKTLSSVWPDDLKEIMQPYDTDFKIVKHGERLEDATRSVIAQRWIELSTVVTDQAEGKEQSVPVVTKRERKKKLTDKERADLYPNWGNESFLAKKQTFTRDAPRNISRVILAPSRD
jgi:hypothetical protein